MEFLTGLGFKKYFQTNAQTTQPEEVPCGLNLQQALGEHIAWHKRFMQVMQGAKDADFELMKVYQDNHSQLGKWLHGEAKNRFGHLPEYAAICKAHTEFHGYAGVTLGQHQMGNEAYAQQLLKDEYRSAFNQVKVGLNHLFGAASFKHSIRRQLASAAV